VVVLTPSSLAVFKGPRVPSWVPKVRDVDESLTWVATVGRPACALGRVEAEVSESRGVWLSQLWRR
jgi:hypothetical protein